MDRSGNKLARNRRSKLSFAALISTAWIAGTATAAPLDFNGPWQVIKPLQALRPDDGSALPFTPAGAAAFQKNRGTVGKDDVDPITRCLPPGVSRLFEQPMPFSVVAGKKLVGFVFQWNHLNRIVYIDTPRFEPIGPAYLGQSVGRWDGATLVIDTNQYNDTTWLDDTGLPHSDQLETIEFVSLSSNGKQLVDKVTFTDPVTFTHAWTTTIRFRREAGVIVREDYCLGRFGKGVTAGG